MVKAGKLLKGISRAFDLPEKTVGLSARVIRERGLMTTGARGLNAPDMTYLDAARQMLGYLFTDKPTMMADATRFFGGFSHQVEYDPDDKRTVEERDDEYMKWLKAELPAGIEIPDLGFLEKIEGPLIFEEAFAAILEQLADPRRRAFYEWTGIEIIGRVRDLSATIDIPGCPLHVFAPDQTYEILWKHAPDMANLMDPHGRLKPSPAKTFAALNIMEAPRTDFVSSIKVDRIFDVQLLASVAKLFENEGGADVL